jgi:uncharacterized protein
MIYRIEIENFYSIRDRQILDLRVPLSVRDFPERYAPLFPGSTERAPKVVAVFGANGSGKSTTLKALSFIKWFITESFKHTGAMPIDRFNDSECANKPIRLAIELSGLTDLTLDATAEIEGSPDNHSLFRYELDLKPVAGFVQTVVREALLYKASGKGRWSRVFERDEGRTVIGSRLFPLGGFGQVLDKIRENASVIATLDLFDHRQAKGLLHAAEVVFHNILVERTELSANNVVQFLSNDPDTLVALNETLQRIDVGIESMRIVDSANGPVAMFRHSNLELEMPWFLESHGTQSFIKVFPLLLLALKHGGVALVDELDQSIHPLILPEIVRWFYDPERNPHSAQLWMSSHSVSLLEDLTKEEVVLCEKDGYGRTQIFSLMDVQSVRRSENLYKKYLGGIYGAIPHIG